LTEWQYRRPVWDEGLMGDWRERTRIWAERYRPEYFTVVNEPEAYIARISNIPTKPDFWRDVTVELCQIAKSKGARKVGVSVPDGSLTKSPHGEHILFANTWPEVDFISYDPFTYRGLMDILRFTEKYEDETI